MRLRSRFLNRQGVRRRQVGSATVKSVTPHVTAEGILEEESPGAWRQRIDVDTEQIASQTRIQNVQAGVRRNIYSKSSTRYDLGADTEIAGEDFEAFILTALLPNTGFNVHIAKMQQ